jgi:hypothetical protein
MIKLGQEVGVHLERINHILGGLKIALYCKRNLALSVQNVFDSARNLRSFDAFGIENDQAVSKMGQ